MKVVGDENTLSRISCAGDCNSPLLVPVSVLVRVSHILDDKLVLVALLVNSVW
jgi:hypothetical protein